MIHSGAFLFPEHGWTDACNVRLVELAEVFFNADAGTQSCVVFDGDAYRLSMEPGGRGVLKLSYFDRPAGGLLYTERVETRTIREVLHRELETSLNLAVQRRVAGDIAPLSAALAKLSS